MGVTFTGKSDDFGNNILSHHKSVPLAVTHIPMPYQPCSIYITPVSGFSSIVSIIQHNYFQELVRAQTTGWAKGQ